MCMYGLRAEGDLGATLLHVRLVFAQSACTGLIGLNGWLLRERHFRPSNGPYGTWDVRLKTGMNAPRDEEGEFLV